MREEREAPSRRPAEEASLLAAARRGDRDAFDSLARRHVVRLVAAARRILRDLAEAEEAAADALVKAYGGLRGFKGEASFGTWAHRITCRVAIDRLRRRRARARLAAEMPVDRPVVRGPADRLEEEDRAAAVRRAVARLPDAQRTVVTLHAWEGLSYREVADLLGSSYDAVRVNMCHARRALRRMLRLDGGEEAR